MNGTVPRIYTFVFEPPQEHERDCTEDLYFALEPSQEQEWDCTEDLYFVLEPPQVHEWGLYRGGFVHEVSLKLRIWIKQRCKKIKKLKMNFKNYKMYEMLKTQYSIIGTVSDFY